MTGRIDDAISMIGDEDRAWQALLQARSHDWSRGPFHYRDCRGGLTLEEDGRYRAQPALDPAASTLIDALAPLVLPNGPQVVAQLGQSLDGRIATESGASHYINGLVGRVHLHRLRALVDAVLVGAGTVADDDPALTVRHVEGPQPLRIALDPRARLSPQRRLFQCEEAPTLHLIGESARPLSGLGNHVETRRLSVQAGAVSPWDVIETLRERGCRRILIEGGSATLSRFLETNALDRLYILVAPLVIGSGRPGISLPPIDTLDQARRPPCRHFSLGEEVLFDLDLRQP